MRLTRFSDIGLRVLMYLVDQQHEHVITVAEVSSQFNVPHNHVVKVVGALARLGLIQATRGRNGGIRLMAVPRAVKVGTVLRALEGDKEAVDCEGIECQLAGDCLLRKALQEGVDAFYNAMNRYTLADLTASGTGEKIVQMHRLFLQR